MKPQRIIGRAPRWPLAQEAAHRQALYGVVAALDQAARQALARHGPALLAAARVRTDDDDEGDEPEEQGDWASILALILFEIGISVAGALALLAVERSIRQRAQAMADFHKRDLRAVVRRAYGVDVLPATEDWLAALLRAWADEGIAAARAMPEQYMARLRAEWGRAVIEGRGLSDLQAVVRDTTAIHRRRAAFAARDGLGRLMAQLTERRYRALGVRSFIWRTMLDERVRVTHRAREGVEFFYNRPGPRPGLEPACRCHAAPILPGLRIEQLRGLD